MARRALPKATSKDKRDHRLIEAYAKVPKLAAYSHLPVQAGSARLRTVNFEGPARCIGQFVDVVVTQAMANSLRGRVVPADAIAAA